MESKVKVVRHAVHPMLIVFPLGLLATAVAFDVVSLSTQIGRFAEVAYYMIAAGVVTGLAAAIIGLIDWGAIPQHTRAKKVGAWHAIGNAAVLLLFVGSWLLRRGNEANPPTVALILSFVGAGFAMVTGWLGGELVERLGIGVSDQANPNAPSSLKPRYRQT